MYVAGWVGIMPSARCFKKKQAREPKPVTARGDRPRRTNVRAKKMARIRSDTYSATRWGFRLYEVRIRKNLAKAKGGKEKTAPPSHSAGQTRHG